MHPSLIKPAVMAAAAAAVTAATIGFSSSASAVDPDPVTGGTTTIGVSLSDAVHEALEHIVVLPIRPATATFDPTRKVLEYKFPVTGGDGSVNTFFGDIKNGGGVRIINTESRRSVKLTNITLTIQDDTVSATPGRSTTPIVFFDAVGEHQFVTSQPESFTASDLQVDAAGASYLDRVLDTDAFVAGQHVGTFATTFTNSLDG